MITLNTLNTLIDDILLIARNSNIVESENINRLQVRQWIDTYRAVLLKQDIDKDGDINPDFTQIINNVPLIVESIFPDSSVCKMTSTFKLPRPLDLNHKYGITSVFDTNGNLIQLGDRMKAIRQKNRRFTCNDYIAYMQNGYLMMMGPNLIESVYVEGVFEDPTEVDDINGDCQDDNAKYPLPYDKIPALKELILSKELGIMIQMPTDTVNNSKNDTLNVGQK